jgi:hypothetical protein
MPGDQEKQIQASMTLGANLASENMMMKTRIRRMIKVAQTVKDAMEGPNPAIVDTIFVTEIGTAVDFLENIIKDGKEALGEVD